MRITTAHLDAKVDIVNRLLGIDPTTVTYRTVGAVVRSGAYGGHGVHRLVSDGGGVTDLMGYHGTAGEAARFLDGLISGLRISADMNAPTRTWADGFGRWHASVAPGAGARGRARAAIRRELEYRNAPHGVNISTVRLERDDDYDATRPTFREA